MVLVLLRLLNHLVVEAKIIIQKKKQKTKKTKNFPCNLPLMSEFRVKNQQLNQMFFLIVAKFSMKIIKTNNVNDLREFQLEEIDLNCVQVW